MKKLFPCSKKFIILMLLPGTLAGSQLHLTTWGEYISEGIISINAFYRWKILRAQY